MANSHIEIERVSKSFVVGGQPLEVLAPIDLSIARGEFVCLIGPSGCGKSTLLRALAGFEAPSGGTIRVSGQQIHRAGPDRGMVFQDYALFPWLTVAQNIAFGLKQRKLPQDEVAAKVENFVKLVGLAKFANAYPHQLSGGMKQRVAIARVLANGAEILLMDEPFGALDAMTRETLQDQLLHLWQRDNLTTLFVTHSVEEAVVLADRVLVMQPGPGRIVADVRIEDPRPRDVSSPSFNVYRRQLSELLRH